MFEGPQYVYKVASVDRVVDGDTVDLVIDLGFSIFTKQRIRLAGIDTPEFRGGTAESKIKAQIAATRLEELLGSGEVFIRTEQDKKGSFGRYLGYLIVVKQGIDFEVNQILLEEGLAEKY